MSIIIEAERKEHLGVIPSESYEELRIQGRTTFRIKEGDRDLSKLPPNLGYHTLIPLGPTDPNLLAYDDKIVEMRVLEFKKGIRWQTAELEKEGFIFAGSGEVRSFWVKRKAG